MKCCNLRSIGAALVILASLGSLSASASSGDEAPTMPGVGTAPRTPVTPDAMDAVASPNFQSTSRASYSGMMAIGSAAKDFSWAKNAVMGGRSPAAGPKRTQGAGAPRRGE